MNASKSLAKDPVCGMSVDTTSALSAERNGQKFYFCCDQCKKKFMSMLNIATEGKNPDSCCGS